MAHSRKTLGVTIKYAIVLVALLMSGLCAATRVVGIQSAYIHSKYIRAKNWWAVAKVLEQAGVDLAETVRAKLNDI